MRESVLNLYNTLTLKLNTSYTTMIDITFSRQLIIIGLLFLMAFSCIDCNNVANDYKAIKPVTASNWQAPDTNSLVSTPGADLIRYGKELIINTAKYLGPKGTVVFISNGMNCGNCHLDGGTRINGNCFAMVAATYPKFRNRSGKSESIQFRINDCLERSLNGKKLDTSSKEMAAMVAYLKWLGKDVPKNVVIKGMGVPEIPLLSRAASVEKGGHVFKLRCSSCHGANGLGLLKPDSSGYIYPPLWGSHSYNVKAGIFRLSSSAGFVKYNMPYNAKPQAPSLTDEEAWDVAAFINTQERTFKTFPNDWPMLSSKPIDYPFGPFSDSFSEQQHKYGPFTGMKKPKNNKVALDK